jgi:hypothetical protein
MKVYIGPYTSWVGPYQLGNFLKRVGLSEERCHAIGDWLSTTWVNTLCMKIEERKKRKVKIRIDNYDTWSMNNTLAMIVVPMLKQLKETKQGATMVEDKDVPAELRTTAAPPKKDSWELDENFFKRWDWALDEMTWAFEQYLPDNEWEQLYWTGEADWSFETLPDGYSKMVTGPNHTLKRDEKGYKKHYNRMLQGMKLFGKYYVNLWD